MCVLECVQCWQAAFKQSKQCERHLSQTETNGKTQKSQNTWEKKGLFIWSKSALSFQNQLIPHGVGGGGQKKRTEKWQPVGVFVF